MEKQKCRDCGKPTKNWVYDGVIVVDGEEDQAYCCKKCWKKREYVLVTFKCKPSKQGIIY